MAKKKLNMTIGRFQPFTQGHLNMVEEGEAPCIVYRINSSDKPIERKVTKRSKGIKIGSKNYTDETVSAVISYIDDPSGDLDEQAKELLKRPFTNELIDKELEIVKKSTKNIIDVIPVKTMYDAFFKFNKFITDHSDEYEAQYWMCGDDRVDDYTNVIDKYDEVPVELGSSEKIPNILKGVLKTNIGKGRTKGISGTVVRKCIINKDKSAFEKIMPKGVGSMFNDFTKAFDDFKNQLQKVISEHSIVSLKDYIIEKLTLNKQSEVIKDKPNNGKTIKDFDPDSYLTHLISSKKLPKYSSDMDPDEYAQMAQDAAEEDGLSVEQAERVNDAAYERVMLENI